jgi:hypothetical protein
LITADVKLIHMTIINFQLIGSVGKKHSYSEAFSNKMTLAEIQDVCNVVCITLTFSTRHAIEPYSSTGCHRTTESMFQP